MYADPGSGAPAGARSFRRRARANPREPGHHHLPQRRETMAKRASLRILGALLVTLLAAAVPLAALAAGAAAPVATLTQISTDPYTNSTSNHQTQVEPDTFAFGSTIVSAFQS